MALSLIEKLRLSLLYGEENRLQRDIGGGYAHGQYLAKARSRQNTVRAEIRALEAKK